ncbi:probable DNA-directed RNA polymerases I and III subunit RPAC2 isoform X2 [Schistocerca cancellata]|uniref:probable DNA-directed RNA polymerases I and III subunit RPAC2 isoform X2 n=1 Tax=Schistocerca cancellata TaxID=274614 RepID=UPI0021183021|nr:probable DNA-directed RNA polymerases I and III subunit RPAC2 isoform X2 [Schistocerca cancellata]
MFFKRVRLEISVFVCSDFGNTEWFCNAKMDRIAELAGEDDTEERNRTFVFADEGHTFGNALRSIIVRYPEVLFCGYTIPHPAETKMHFRIQTNGPRAADILKRGIEDLEKAEMEEFKAP